MTQVTRRIVSTAIALMMAVSPVLVCVPVAAAATQEGHCQPPAPPAGHDCAPAAPDRMDCCAARENGSPTLPASNPGQTSRVDGGTSVLQADGALSTVSHARPALTALLRAAPLHGYRSIDLPTLNAAFLI